MARSLYDLIRPREHRRRDRAADALAVFRLIASSNSVGCSTGRVAGLPAVRPGRGVRRSWIHQLAGERDAEEGVANGSGPVHSHSDFGRYVEGTERGAQALGGREDVDTEGVRPLARHDEEMHDRHVQEDGRDRLWYRYVGFRRHEVENETFPGRNREDGIVDLIG